MKKQFFIEDLSPLYEEVQSAGIFPDSKYFPDSRPKSSATVILNAYTRAKTQPGFDLKNFVEAHFEAPHSPDSGYASAGMPLAEHLEHLWTVLTRTPDSRGGTLIPLPFPYIVPGGRFREIYYWDSYFTMLGLQVSGRTDLIQHIVDNFAHLIDTLGFIPNGNRSYYQGRSQPPFFVLMVGILAEEKGPAIWQQYRRHLETEYKFWMQGALKKQAGAYKRVVHLPDGSVMNRFWDDRDTPRPEAYMEDLHVSYASKNDPATTYRHIRAAAESGWDFSSRWFADGRDMATIQTTDLIPVDLNCLLFKLEDTLAEAFAAAGEMAPAGRYRAKAERRRAAILRYCWNETAGFFFDFDHVRVMISDKYTLAGLFPLFFHLADAVQAQKVAEVVEHRFLHPGGLCTTLANTGQQWDAPNGWAPLQWVAYKGLHDYGYTALAANIRRHWMQTCEKVYAETGKMMEKYNVVDTQLKAGGGEYPNQDGFGWTNGVYLRFRHDLNRPLTL